MNCFVGTIPQCTKTNFRSYSSTTKKCRPYSTDVKICLFGLIPHPSCGNNYTTWIIGYFLLYRYGSSQMFKIPQGDFKFLSHEETRNIDWLTIDLKGNTGYFVEVDIDYPESIWEQTKDFPLAPENIDITYDMLSPFQKSALKNIYNKETYTQRKLTATFLPKKKM